MLPVLYAPDLNVIPAPLIKRVDVLTGGASTTYGSDAMAGVVNFVMDTDFEGVRGGVQYSAYNHDNNNKLAQQINTDAVLTSRPARPGTATASTPTSPSAASSPTARATRRSTSTTASSTRSPRASATI